MDIYTLDRGFKRVDLIDDFESAIWKEGVYGDGNFELNVPLSQKSYDALALDTLMECEQSDIPMILDTRKIEEGMIKCEGISLLQWMDNRFMIPHYLIDMDSWSILAPVGSIMKEIVQNFLVSGDYLTDSEVYWIYTEDPSGDKYQYPDTNFYAPVSGPDGHPNNDHNSMGIYHPSHLKIPGLVVASYDSAGGAVDIKVPQGPIFSILKDMAETYNVGQKITLDSVTDASYTLGYRNFRGLDRTSDQGVRPVVRFSPELGPLKNIREFQSSRNKKTRIYMVPTNEWLGDPGAFEDQRYTSYGPLWGMYFDDVAKPGGFDRDFAAAQGFDMRAAFVTNEKIGPWDIGYTHVVDTETGEEIWGEDNPDWTIYRANLYNAMVPHSKFYLNTHKTVKTVDGELEESTQFVYGTDYSMGDILELEGYTGNIGKIQVVEWVISQDKTGEKSYPGVKVIE